MCSAVDGARERKNQRDIWNSDSTRISKSVARAEHRHHWDTRSSSIAPPMIQTKRNSNELLILQQVSLHCMAQYSSQLLLGAAVAVSNTPNTYLSTYASTNYTSPEEEAEGS